jgi:hypothetical protein
LISNILGKEWQYTYTTMMWLDEKIFSTRTSYVIVGCESPTDIPSGATTTPFTDERDIDAACSIKTISISVSVDRKSDGEIRSGCCRRR